MREVMPEVRFPANMLACQALAREVVFSSVEIIEKLTLVQTMYLHGQVVESLHFPFPFVMPNTTNSWEQTIVADSENMLPAQILSGNLVCVTQFKAYDKVIHESFYRIFYD
jgi:retinal rod rhodopsin-sensitive cGMP 3',5'-cyclic phosphodiesterase subunit delta